MSEDDAVWDGKDGVVRDSGNSIACNGGDDGDGGDGIVDNGEDGVACNDENNTTLNGADEPKEIGLNAVEVPEGIT